MSPYKSVRQRAFMHINKPEIAKKWDKKYGTKIASARIKVLTEKGGNRR